MGSANLFIPNIIFLKFYHPKPNEWGDSDGCCNCCKFKGRDNYDTRKQRVEISPEKQKLVNSLFGSSTKSEKRSSTGNKVLKASASTSAADRTQESKAAVVHSEVAREKTNQQPPPDLLDLNDPTSTVAPPSVDPFKQLEGLLDPSISSTTDHSSGAVTNSPDIMALYVDTPASRESSSGGYSFPVSGDNVNLLSESSSAAIRGTTGETTVTPSVSVKGPNAKDSLQKDAKVRLMGVTPTSQNPNLFKDLLG